MIQLSVSQPFSYGIILKCSSVFHATCKIVCIYVTLFMCEIIIIYVVFYVKKVNILGTSNKLHKILRLRRWKCGHGIIILACSLCYCL